MSAIDLDEVAVRWGVCTKTIRRWLRDSPKDLPGRPFAIGVGSRRHHLRWLESDLDVWLTAFAKWQRGEWRPPARRTGRRS
jgi:hypothetical protein